MMRAVEFWRQTRQRGLIGNEGLNNEGAVEWRMIKRRIEVIDNKGENIGIMDKIERVMLRMAIDGNESDVKLLEERSTLEEDRNIADCIDETEDMVACQCTTGRMNRFDKFVIEMREGKLRCDVMMQKVKIGVNGIQQFRDQLRWMRVMITIEGMTAERGNGMVDCVLKGGVLGMPSSWADQGWNDSIEYRELIQMAEKGLVKFGAGDKQRTEYEVEGMYIGVLIKMVWELAARRVSIESKIKKKEKVGIWGELSKLPVKRRNELMGVADRYINDMRKEGWDHSELEVYINTRKNNIIPQF